MNEAQLKKLLHQVAQGEVEVEEAIGSFKGLPFADLGFARVDHLRPLISGLEEVILAEPKSIEEVVAIALNMWQTNGRFLATRVSKEQGQALQQNLSQGTYDPIARTFSMTSQEDTCQGTVTIVSAGTGDRSVANEARVTLEYFRHQVYLVEDSGVAGIHRLLPALNQLRESVVVIVVAGMEGALTSLVASLVNTPVIGVPTSVGYGVATHGKAALFSMLSSCAPGVSVVNIDNGFGAACQAALIVRKYHAMLEKMKQSE